MKQRRNKRLTLPRIFRLAGALLAVFALFILAQSSPSRIGDAAQAAAPATRFTPLYNFPHLFSYSRWGAASALPYMTGGDFLTGAANTSVINQTARNQVMTLPVEPATSDALAHGSSSVLTKMRQANPGAVILGYWWTDFPWQTADEYNGQSVPFIVGDVVAYVKAQGWAIMNEAGAYWGGPFGPLNLDFANPDFVTWYIDFIDTRIHDTGLWDGIFFDNFCGRLNTTGMRLTQHGHTYASLTEYNNDHAAGLTTFIQGLRQRVGDQFLLVGNCGFGNDTDTLNGSMTEYFPQFKIDESGFGNWWWNMFSPNGGYVVHDAMVQAPGLNFLTHFVDDCTVNDGNGCTTWDPTLATNAANQQKMRYGLTSALLGNGFYFYDEDHSANPVIEGDTGWSAYQFWYDEYDNGGQGIGYLGQPTSIPYQMIDATKLSAPDHAVNGGFESALGAEWYTAAIGTGNTWARDTGVAHGGSASLRAIIQTPVSDANWFTEVAQQTKNLTLITDDTYSMTFWAKSDRTRSIRATIKDIATLKTSQILTVDQTWRQYQVAARITSGTDKNVILGFYVGSEIGTVWIDDVQLNQGYGHLWTREFEHGKSFVNPGLNSLSFDVSDGGSAVFRHINGSINPTLNDGLDVTTLTLTGTNGVVLISKTNPPSAPQSCDESWSCGGWTCTGGQQTRVCTDANACQTTASKPSETGENCGSPATVDPPPIVPVTPVTPSDTTPPSRVTDLIAE